MRARADKLPSRSLWRLACAVVNLPEFEASSVDALGAWAQAREAPHRCLGQTLAERLARGRGDASHRFGQGTVGLTVTVSPLRNVTSTFPLKPPFGHVLGTVP